MNSALAYALKLEERGDIYAALRTCRAALRADPSNADIAVLFARLNLNHRVGAGVDMAMLQRFMSADERERREFKRWLIDGL